MRCTLTLLALTATLPAQSTPYAAIPGSQVPLANWIWGLAAATAGDVIHTAWAIGTTFHYSRSTDRGRSWLPTPMTFPGGSPVDVSLSASAQNVYFFHSDPTAPLVCSSSIDGGVTWRPPAPLLPANGAIAVTIANGASIHVLLWVSTSQLGYTRSTDGGLTWPPAPVILGSAASTPQLALVGNTLHAAWAGIAGIQYSRSTDGGMTWQGTQVLAPVMNQTAQAALVATGPTVCLAHQPSWNTTVSVIRSVDAGVTWQSPTILGAGRGVLGAVDGNGICFASMAGGSPATVLMAHSVDAGQTWQGSTQQFPLTGNTILRSLVYRNRSIGLAFECVDYFLPAYIAYPGIVIVSKDQGATWLQSQQVGDLLHGVRYPVLLSLADSIALVWGSTTNNYTNADHLWSSLLFGYQPYGTAKPGTGNVAPRLDGNGEPHTGSTTTIAMSNGRGGSLALIAASFGGPASVPFGSGTLLVQQPTLNLVGTTTGASGAPGAGTLALQFTIPTGNAFRNQRLDFQGFVLDAAAANGFAATAGLELWTF